MKPARERFWREQRSKIPKGIHKRILYGVFRQVAVAEYGKRAAERPCLKPPHYLLIAGEVAGLCPAYEVANNAQMSLPQTVPATKEFILKRAT